MARERDSKLDNDMPMTPEHMTRQVDMGRKGFYDESKGASKSNRSGSSNSGSVTRKYGREEYKKGV